MIGIVSWSSDLDPRAQVTLQMSYRLPKHILTFQEEAQMYIWTNSGIILLERERKLNTFSKWQQKSSDWQELRDRSVLAGSTLYKVLAFTTFTDQQPHFDKVMTEKQKTNQWCTSVRCILLWNKAWNRCSLYTVQHSHNPTYPNLSHFRAISHNLEVVQRVICHNKHLIILVYHLYLSYRKDKYKSFLPA